MGKEKVNEKHRPRLACPAALFQPPSLLGGAFYTTQSCSITSIWDIVTLKNCCELRGHTWIWAYVAFNDLSVISRRCLDVAGSSMLTFRVLLHWIIILQTIWHDIPPSHIILTLSWPVLALLSKCRAPSERAASTILKVFGMTRDRIRNLPVTKRTLYHWATVPVYSGFRVHMWTTTDRYAYYFKINKLHVTTRT